MISIETINGEKRLVIWYDALGRMDKTHWMKCWQGLTGISALEYDCIATALPPLPRHPKNDEATVRLLYLYRSFGIYVWMKERIRHETIHHSWMGQDGVSFCLHMDEYLRNPEITHATYNGERIQLVFEGDE